MRDDDSFKEEIHPESELSARAESAPAASTTTSAASGRIPPRGEGVTSDDPSPIGRWLGEAMVRSSQWPAHLITDDGHHVVANDEGKALVRRLVLVGSSGKLFLISPDANEDFQSAKDRFTADKQLMALHKRLTPSLTVALRRYRDGQGQVVPGYVIVTIHEATQDPRWSAKELGERLGLPEKQAEVMHALLGTGILPGFVDEDEEEDDSLAAQRQRRMSRFHLDALFRRFNVRTRTDLVRRAALLLGAIW